MEIESSVEGTLRALSEEKTAMSIYFLRVLLGGLPLAGFSYVTLMRLGEITEMAARFRFYPAFYLSFFLLGYLLLSLGYFWFFCKATSLEIERAVRVDGLMHLVSALLLPYLFGYDFVHSQLGFSLFYVFVFLFFGLRVYVLARNGRGEARPILTVAGIVVLGALLRLSLLFTSQGMVGSEEAIMGLMARHMLFNRESYVFLWGQPYMGSLEAILAVPVFFLFGASPLTLKLVPFVFSLFFIAASYFLVKLMLGEEAALVSALLVSVSPVFLTVFSMLANAYIENLFYGTVVLILSYLIAFRSEGKRQLYLFLLLGLVAGVAFWNNLNSMIYLLAAFVFLALERRRWSSGYLPKILTLLAGLVFGSLPLWLFNLKHQWITFRFLGGGVSASASLYDRVAQLFTNFRNLLGVSRAIVGGGQSIATDFAVYLLYGLSLLYALYYFFAKKDAEETAGRSGIKLLLILTLMLAIFFSISRYGSLNEARYALALYLALPAFLALLLRDLGKKSRALATVLLVVVLFSSMLGNVRDTRIPPPRPELVASFLNSSGVSYVYASFWTAYQLTFVSKERIVAYAVSGPNVYPPYVERVREAGSRQKAVIFNEGTSFGRFERKLLEESVTFRKAKLAGKTIFYSFSKDVEPFLDLERS